VIEADESLLQAVANLLGEAIPKWKKLEGNIVSLPVGASALIMEIGKPESI